MVQLVRLTTCVANGAPTQAASPGAKRLNVTVPVGGLLLMSGARPVIVAESVRLTGDTVKVPPGPGVVPMTGKETSAEPKPLPGLLFTASVALAPASTAV